MEMTEIITKYLKKHNAPPLKLLCLLAHKQYYTLSQLFGIGFVNDVTLQPLSSSLLFLRLSLVTHKYNTSYQIMIMFYIRSLDLHSLWSLNNVRDYGSTVWKKQGERTDYKPAASPFSTVYCNNYTWRCHSTMNNECATSSRLRSLWLLWSLPCDLAALLTHTH